jgi:Mycothiol maleylpyruvate isomerase N-terminal domain
MANKDEVVAKIESLQGEIEQAVTSMPEAAWSKGVYEDGWNAQQLLSHIASTTGSAGFLLRMGAAGSGGTVPAGFDNNPFNRQQVAARQDKSPAERWRKSRASSSAISPRCVLHRMTS